MLDYKRIEEEANDVLVKTGGMREVATREQLAKRVLELLEIVASKRSRIEGLERELETLRGCS